MENLVRINQALQSFYESQKFGLARRRNLLQETYQPLVSLLEKSKEKKKKKQPTTTTTTAAEEDKDGFNDASASSSTFKKEDDSDFPQQINDDDEDEVNFPSADKFDDDEDEDEVNFRNSDDKNDVYGIRFGEKENEVFIGNTRVSVADKFLTLNNRDKSQYTMTEGLWELLTKLYPNEGLVDANDVLNYKDILQKTNSYKDSSGRAHFTRTPNYLKYIQPWATKQNKRKQTPSATGSGIQMSKKILTNSPIEYVYWNNPKELLDRLYIVYGEIQAGNTNPNLKNELVNILNEFKEEKWHI